MTGWLEASRVYLDRRIVAMIFLGFASGLPFGVLADPLTAWLAEAGVTKTSIGLFAWLSIPFGIKFVWAPLIDHVPLPVLSRALGRRRGWVILTQILLVVAIFGLGQTDPAIYLWRTALFSLIVAFLAASQDIALDAYRIEILAEDQLAAGSANWTFGWRIAQVGGAALGLIFADIFPWTAVFTGLAAFIGVGIIAILINPEPARPPGESTPAATVGGAWISYAFVAPFIEFIVGRRGWLAILLLILLYKFGDAVLTQMKIPFFLEIGFSKTDIALYSKGIGWVTTVFFTLLGGLFAVRVGLVRAMFLAGILMALTNLMFSVLAWSGKSELMFAFAVVMDDLAGAFATVTFVAFISMLVDRTYTATQYALLASIGTAGRTLFASGSGALVDWLNGDWGVFFVITAVMVLPSLLCLWLIRHQLARMLVGSHVRLFSKEAHQDP